MVEPQAAAVERSSAGRHVAVWMALVVLTATTWGVSRIDLGWMNLPLALLIATSKAALVVYFFMHLWQHAPANRLVMLAALAFVGLLTLFTLADLATRDPVESMPGPWFKEQPLPR